MAAAVHPKKAKTLCAAVIIKDVLGRYRDKNENKRMY
jgi:hypothetical protein